ncbi:hypothetical protein V5O48_012238 [Marasmius crinis-equi]|uniref:Uncharacterized protein n=1 Tax=Marasmius crinis-equi TaxID=585013 RepID=A0ABR3F3T1_9AGAR
MFSSDNDSAAVRTPFLQTCLTHVWVKTVALEHPSIYEWAQALVAIAFGIRDDSEEKPQPVPENEELTSIWNRHVLRESFYIKYGSLKDVKSFYSFIVVRSNDTVFEGGKDSYVRSVVRRSLSSHVRLLSTLLTKKKDAREAVLGSDACLTHHGLAVAMAGLIKEAMVGLPQVLEAVEAGLLVSLFNSYAIYFQCDSEKEKHHLITYLDLLCRIIVQINKFLVYPSVFHAYRRVTKKIVKSAELEEELKSKGESLWTCWFSLVRKASILQLLRDSRKKQEGKILSDQETHFFKEFTRFGVIQLFPKAVNDAVDDFVSSLQTSVAATKEANSIADKTRYPIVVVDFTVFDFPRKPGHGIECLDPTKFVERYQARLGLEQTLALIEQWEGTVNGTGAISAFVVSLFPKTRDEAWSFGKLFLFPLNVPEKDYGSDSEESSSKDSESESGDQEGSDSEDYTDKSGSNEGGTDEGNTESEVY